MSFKKNQKGVAIIWALVAMLVIVLVVTGILMMAQVFNKRENTSVLETQADYYARSGVNIISAQITSGSFDTQIGKLKYDEKDKNKGEESEFECVVEVTDGDEKIPISVTVKKDKGSQLDIEATYENTNGTISRTVHGKMGRKNGKWAFSGFYVK